MPEALNWIPRTLKTKTIIAKQLSSHNPCSKDFALLSSVNSDISLRWYNYSPHFRDEREFT